MLQFSLSLKSIILHRLGSIQINSTFVFFLSTYFRRFTKTFGEKGSIFKTIRKICPHGEKMKSDQFVRFRILNRSEKRPKIRFRFVITSQKYLNSSLNDAPPLKSLRYWTSFRVQVLYHVNIHLFIYCYKCNKCNITGSPHAEYKCANVNGHEIVPNAYTTFARRLFHCSSAADTFFRIRMKFMCRFHNNHLE